MSTVSKTKSEKDVFIAFFGGAGDGPGLANSQIVKSVASAGFVDPRKIGLSGAKVAAESKYLEWSDAAFGRPKAKDMLAHINEKCLAMPVVFVAHSYGCEAAMKTIAKLNATITHLVTIDGVSWETKFFGDSKPSNVKEWTNVFVSGVSDFTDVIALVGGQWKNRTAATRNIDVSKFRRSSGPKLSHGDFLAMWGFALPHVKKSIGLDLD